MPSAACSPTQHGPLHTKNSGKEAGKKSVHFAPKQQTLYFLPYRPASITAEPICELQVVPLNCPIIGNGAWLSEVALMRQEPFCKLDYIRAGTEDDREDAALFHCEFDGHDPEGSPHAEHFLIGEVAVYNLSFQKEVLIHYTFDCWATKLVAVARYASSIATLRIDKFKFTLAYPAHLSRVHMEIAVEYSVGRVSYWDSLEGVNYKFYLEKRPVCFEGIPESEVDPVVPIQSSLVSIAIPIPTKKPTFPTGPFLPPLGRSSWSNAPLGASSQNLSLSSTYQNPVAIPRRAASWDCTKSFTLIAMATNASARINPLESFIPT